MSDDLIYVAGDPCIDNLDKSCVDSCPVDCIYVGERKVYVHPEECIGCGACIVVCPVDAIFETTHVPEGQQAHVEDAHRFFFSPLPGREEPLGAPGGAEEIGAVGIDTELLSRREAA